MPRIKKFSPVQNLSGIQTFILDEQINSKYFRITEFKETFTGGKNGFLIEGSEFLKEGVEIKIDITDVNGDPIYYEPGDGIPEYYEGTSKLVSVYVYQDTPIGQSNITILGELKKYEDETGLVRDIPDEWKGIYNVKWQRTFNVNKNLQNEDKVRFFRRPNVTIDEIVKPVFSVNPRTKSHSGSLDGVALSPANGTNIEDYTLPTTYRIFRKSGPVFSGSMVGNPIQFDNLQYSPTIIDVVNEGELVVDTPYTQNSIVSSFTDGLYTSSFIYLEDGDELATALTASFAKIKITDMKTFVGDAARVKVFRRSQSQLTDFEFVQEIQLESNELLRDLDSKNEVELSYGLLTEQVFQNYWVTSSNDLTTQINQNVLYNSVELDSIGVNSFFTNETFDVNENVEYTLTFSVKKSGPINEDEYIKPFLGSTPGPVIEDTSGAIPCAQAASYTGGESYPTEQTVNLGENTGPTELQYNAINVPDRFIVEWDGNVVIDSGYVGSSDYDLGGLSRSTFTSALTGEIDPITENTYPDFVTYPDDGYPRVTTQANPALPDGSGSANFNKTFSSPQLADVKVYAPLGGTAWDLTLFCPVNPPALDVERISNPDTIQEIATIRASNDLLQKFEVEENFIANNIDDVRLYFEVSGSNWYISNISLKASQETSFSPDEITFIQQVPKTLETETFEYRFEFYDINNNFIPVRVNQTKTFTGGNLNLFQKSIELIPDNLYFSFDSASNPANAIPPTVINFDVETTLVTGSINYTSQSFDLSGNLIPSSAYSAVTDVYPGLLDTTDNRAPFLTVANFTGSKDEYVVQFVRITGEVEGVSDTVIITRVEDGKGGVNFLIKPFRGTSIKNKEDKSLELQAIRIDGVNEIELRSGLERNFSDAKLHLLSSSFNGATQVETYVSLSQAITDTNFITGVSAGTTGSGEIDYNAQFNRDAIDNELIVYLMDGPTSESILTSLILNDLKDGLNNGTIEATNNTFTIKPREERIFTPVNSIVTASFYERGNTETPLTGGMVITPSMSLEPKTELPEFYMFYETASFERRISLNVTDGNGNSIESGIPNVTPNVNYTPIQTKQLNVEFIYTEDVTDVQISNSQTFTIVPEGLPGQDAIVIELTPNPVSVGANSKGEVSNYDLLDTTIEVKQGDLFLINTASSDPGTFTTSSITLNGIEFDRLDGNTETSMSLVGFNSMSALSASVTYDFDIYPYFTSSLLTRRVVQRFNKSIDGAGAIEVLIEPINASINADESGFINADKYSILDTTLKVKQSEEFLVFDNQDLGIPGTYSASIVPNGILINEISSSSQDPNTSGDDTLHIQNFNNFVISEASASVDYNLTVYPYSLKDGVAGVPTNITRRQIFSKVNDGSAARRVKLSSNTVTVVYDENGDIETPAGSIVLTAASSNTSGSVYYIFRDEDNNILQGPLTSNTYTVTDPPDAGNQATYTVELLDGGASAQVFDTDSVTISAIQSGQSTYNVILSNSSATVEVEIDGTLNLDETKTEIRAFKAGNELDIVDTFGTTTSGPPDFLPVVINEASASIVDYSPHITLLDNKLGENTSNLFVTSSGLASWTNPQVNRTAFVTYKVDFEDGRAIQQITQTFTAVFDGATGPGIVFRGEWTGSVDYLFEQDNRKDAILWDKNSDGTPEMYYATLSGSGPNSQVVQPTYNSGSGTISVSGLSVSGVSTDFENYPYVFNHLFTEDEQLVGKISSINSPTSMTLVSNVFGNIPPGANYKLVSGSVIPDSGSYWEELGEEEFFVAAKFAIFEESFIKNTVNVGTPAPGEENAKIAIVGGTDEPYISVGQVEIQGFGQPGAFLGLSKDGSAGTTGIFSLRSNASTIGSSINYTGLDWDGLTLTVRGLIRQTSTSEPLGDVRGEWTAGVTYFTNDIVYYQGSSYSMIAPTSIVATNDTDIDTGFPTDATNSWEIAIAAGTSGTAGLAAKNISVSADSQIFIFDNFGDNTAENDTIRVYVDQQNLSGTIATGDITITDAGSIAITTPSLTGTVTNGTGQQYFDISFLSTLSADKTKLPIQISVTKDGITDVTTIYKVEGGADSDPQYFITPLNGTQIKNANGGIELQVQSSDPVNGLQDITTGTDARIYSGSDLLAVQTGVTDGGNGVEYNPIISASAINGTLTLTLRSGSSGTDGILDTITLVDVTDGLGGGTFLSPNLKTTRDPSDNSYTPANLSATASFFTPDGTEYTSSVSITPSFSDPTDFMAVSTAVGDTTNISITAGNGDGGTITLGGSPVATKDTVLVATFTDPNTNQTSTITETFYIISDGLDGIDAITVTNTNQSHTLPANTSGVVSDYSNSGTKIEVYEGNTKLAYDGGDPPADSSFTIGNIVISPVGDFVVDATPTEGANFIEYGDGNSMADGTDIVTVTYGITGSRASGTEFKIDTIQTITKSKGGETGASLNIIFIRSATQPSTPSPSSGIPAGWSDSPPAGTDLLWASQGIKGVGETNFTWGTPYQVEGTAVVEIAIYKLVTSGNPAPTAPNPGGSFDFTTSTLTEPAGWLASVPTLSSDGDKVYLVTGLFSGAPTDTSATTTWSTPVVYAQRTDGVSGTSGTDGSAGSAGIPGPGVVFRGEWDSVTSYISNDDRRDIVDYSSVNAANPFWIALQNSTNQAPPSSGGAPNSYWETFGATFTSVATGILLAEDATITKGLVIGQSGTTNAFIRTDEAYTPTSGSGYYLDETGQFFFGEIDAAGEGNYVSFDGTNIVLSGEIQSNTGNIGSWDIVDNGETLASSNSNILLKGADEEIEIIDTSGNVKFRANTNTSLPNISAVAGTIQPINPGSPDGDSMPLFNKWISYVPIGFVQISGSTHFVTQSFQTFSVGEDGSYVFNYVLDNSDYIAGRHTIKARGENSNVSVDANLIVYEPPLFQNSTDGRSTETPRPFQNSSTVTYSNTISTVVNGATNVTNTAQLNEGTFNLVKDLTSGTTYEAAILFTVEETLIPTINEINNGYYLSSSAVIQRSEVSMVDGEIGYSSTPSYTAINGGGFQSVIDEKNYLKVFDDPSNRVSTQIVGGLQIGTSTLLNSDSASAYIKFYPPDKTTTQFNMWNKNGGYLVIGDGLLPDNSQEIISFRNNGNVEVQGNFNTNGNSTVQGSATVQGNLNVVGSKNFKIQHPLKEDAYLIHSAVESPKLDLIYRGNIKLISGSAEINLDNESKMMEGTFEKLTTNVQCFTTNETSWFAVKGKVSGNILTIESQNTTSNDNISWLVIAERNDIGMKSNSGTDELGSLITEVSKIDYD